MALLKNADLTGIWLTDAPRKGLPYLVNQILTPTLVKLSSLASHFVDIVSRNGCDRLRHAYF